MATIEDRFKQALRAALSAPPPATDPAKHREPTTAAPTAAPAQHSADDRLAEIMATFPLGAALCAISSEGQLFDLLREWSGVDVRDELAAIDAVLR